MPRPKSVLEVCPSGAADKSRPSNTLLLSPGNSVSKAVNFRTERSLSRTWALRRAARMSPSLIIDARSYSTGFIKPSADDSKFVQPFLEGRDLFFGGAASLATLWVVGQDSGVLNGDDDSVIWSGDALLDVSTPPYWSPNPQLGWPPRKIWVLRGIPSDARPYGKRILYVDVKASRPLWSQIPDESSELLRFHHMQQQAPVGENGYRAVPPVQGQQIDFKCKHATNFASIYVINYKCPVESNFSLSA